MQGWLEARPIKNVFDLIQLRIDKECGGRGRAEGTIVSKDKRMSPYVQVGRQ